MDRLHHPVPAERALVLLVTSGTTGQPARFIKTAGQLLGEAADWGSLLEFQPGDVLFASAAGHHLYGLLFGVLIPFFAGVPFDSSPSSEPSRFHPVGAAQRMRAIAATHLVTVPAHAAALAELAPEVPSVREVVSSAAPLPATTARAIEGLWTCRVQDVLGSTETGGIALRRPAHTERYVPLPGVELQTAQDGELLVCSAYAGHGSGRGAIRSGDRVELLPDGSFRHLGRFDGIVKVGGKRTALAEIEAAALAHPGVRAAVCLHERQEGLRGGRLWLFVEADTESPEALRAHLRAHIDPLFVPRKIRVLPRLPRNERGKVPHRDLWELVRPRSGDPADVAHERRAARDCATQGELTAQGAASGALERQYVVSMDSPRFRGHFPGAPTFPGIAQLVDWVLPLVEELGLGPVREVHRLKFLRPVEPGARVVVQVRSHDGRVSVRARDATGAQVLTGTLGVGLSSGDDLERRGG